MDDLYRENILDHYKHPQNFGSIKNANLSAQESVVSCGDDITIELLLENNIVTTVGFYGKGCAISMAAASMLTEKVKGKSIHVLKEVSSDDIVAMLGITLTPTRLKCALLSLEVLHKALAKNGKLQRSS